MSSKFRQYTNYIVISSVGASIVFASQYHPHIDVTGPRFLVATGSVSPGRSLFI
jgi:hypothetical protein